MRKLSLKNENRGASLLAVLIVLVVVSVIAVEMCIRDSPYGIGHSVG